MPLFAPAGLDYRPRLGSATQCTVDRDWTGR